MIPYSRQNIDKNDIKSVTKVLKSDYLTQGPKVEIFEKKINKYCGVKFGVAVNSATSALHIACISLELKKEDIVWTSPNSFVASANCALYCGATIDFVDIDPKTFNMSIESLKKKLELSKKEKKLPKVVIPVHFAGQPINMGEIYRLSKIYKFKIIEDASHALGAIYYHNKKKIKVGSCKHSHITVLSFHPVKIITSGEGGIALTNDKKIFDKLKMLRTSGITRDKKLMKKSIKGMWYYEQLMLGYNYRLNEIQAALGIQQLKKINKLNNLRNKIAKKYNLSLKTLPLYLPHINSGFKSSFHLYVVVLKNNKKKIDRAKLFNKLRKFGILVNVHYIPIYRHPFYQNLGFNPADFPNCEKYYKNAISIPIFPGLKKKQQDYVISCFKKIFK